MVQKVARDIGWEIVAVVPSEGRVEATDTTWYFGFKDDVVIRVVPDRPAAVSMCDRSPVWALAMPGPMSGRVRLYLKRLRELAGK